MERKIANLFDFQKFQQHPALQRVIDSVHSRYVAELSPENMEWVSAAGIPDLARLKKGNAGDDPFRSL